MELFIGHDLKAIPHPGNEAGYLFLPKEPGRICGWLPPESQVFECTVCKVQMTSTEHPDGPIEEGDNVRISFGGFGPSLYSAWTCDAVKERTS